MKAASVGLTEIEEDPDFRKSFLKTRVVVGVIGVALAPVVVLTDRVAFDGQLRPTLSDYYYSSMGDWFVGSLWAIGSGLLIYLRSRPSPSDSTISFVAGLCAVGVALCPTSPGPDGAGSLVSTLHVVFAAALFVLLAVMSIRFGRRDGRRAGRGDGWQRTWRAIHIGCGASIVVLIILIAVVGASGAKGSLILLFEALAVTAFGLSWFLKGSELFNLLREERGESPLLRGRPQSAPPPPEAPATAAARGHE